MNWIIYTLKNPRTREVRYVGFTSTSPERRLTVHIQHAVSKHPNTHRAKWILSLVSIGLRPVLEIIESGSGDGWGEAEQRWIRKFRAEGARLTNATDGGEGAPGADQTKKSASLKRAWAKFTPEERRALVLKKTAAITPEQRTEALKKVWAKVPLAERSEIAKARWAKKTPQEISAIVRASQAGIPPEQRALIRQKMSATALASSEKRSNDNKKRWAKFTPDERRLIMDKVRIGGGAK